MFFFLFSISQLSAFACRCLDEVAELEIVVNIADVLGFAVVYLFFPSVASPTQVQTPEY